jgi:hypothetical protein
MRGRDAGVHVSLILLPDVLRRGMLGVEHDGGTLARRGRFAAPGPFWPRDVNVASPSGLASIRVSVNSMADGSMACPSASPPNSP